MKGLANLGNTCYFNSMLQCLLNCNPLVNYFLNHRYKGTNKHVLKFGNVVKLYWTDEQNIIQPTNTLKMLCAWAPQFEGFRQQDSHEAYLCFIEGLHQCLKEEYTGTRYNICIQDKDARNQWNEEKSSIITEIFMGQLKVTVDDTHYETFRSLEVSTAVDTTVEALVFDFFKPEQTQDSKLTIKRRIKYPPLVLPIVIKQFFRKNTVEFKEHLDLTWYVDEPFKKVYYKLYGIIVHGGNRNGGHYISMTRWNDQWYENNDSRVTEINFEDVPKNNIYMLFYIRVNSSDS